MICSGDAERIDPVHRNSWPYRIEGELRIAKRRGRVREVARTRRKNSGDGTKGLGLLIDKVAIGIIGGGQVTHQARQTLGTGPTQDLISNSQRLTRAQAPPPHPCFDLDVHINLMAVTQTIPALERRDRHSTADFRDRVLLSCCQRRQHEQRRDR